MSKVLIKPETVYCYNTDFVRGVKDLGLFAGPNMWHLQIKNRAGEWDSVQWMDVSGIERVLDRPEPMTRYPEVETQYENV